MDYEMMVKEAYEEIMGFDKEAGDWAEPGYSSMLSEVQKSAIRRFNSSPGKDKRLENIKKGTEALRGKLSDTTSKLTKVQNSVTDMYHRGQTSLPAYGKLKEMQAKLSKDSNSTSRKINNLENMTEHIRRGIR